MKVKDKVAWVILFFLALSIIYGYLETLNHLDNLCELFLNVLIVLGDDPAHLFLPLVQSLKYVGLLILAKNLPLNIVSHPPNHILQDIY